MTPTVQIGPHRLYLGDAYAIRPALGWQDADVMDPPYRFRTSGGGAFRKKRGHTKQIADEGMDKGFDHRIINPLLCGSAVVFCHNDQLPAVVTHLDGSFERNALCIWQKKNPMPVANKHYRPDIEIYIHAWTRGYHPQGELADKARVTIAHPPRRKTFGHATVKPCDLMAKIIRNVAGETVCDPFMGTASTGVAAIRAGRVFTGIEHNPQHFETAVQRIRKAFEASTVQDN